MIKLAGLAFFLPIRLAAVPWSGETLKYFKPRVILIASKLNENLNYNLALSLIPVFFSVVSIIKFKKNNSGRISVRESSKIGTGVFLVSSIWCIPYLFFGSYNQYTEFIPMILISSIVVGLIVGFLIGLILKK